MKYIVNCYICITNHFISNEWKSQTNLTPLAKKNLPTLFIIRLPL